LSQEFVILLYICLLSLISLIFTHLDARNLKVAQNSKTARLHGKLQLDFVSIRSRFEV